MTPNHTACGCDVVSDYLERAALESFPSTHSAGLARIDVELTMCSQIGCNRVLAVDLNPTPEIRHHMSVLPDMQAPLAFAHFLAWFAPIYLFGEDADLEPFGEHVLTHWEQTPRHNTDDVRRALTVRPGLFYVDAVSGQPVHLVEDTRRTGSNFLNVSRMTDAIADLMGLPVTATTTQTDRKGREHPRTMTYRAVSESPQDLWDRPATLTDALTRTFPRRTAVELTSGMLSDAQRADLARAGVTFRDDDDTKEN